MAIKKGQCRQTGNIGYTRRVKTKQKHNTNYAQITSIKHLEVCGNRNEHHNTELFVPFRDFQLFVVGCMPYLRFLCLPTYCIVSWFFFFGGVPSVFSFLYFHCLTLRLTNIVRIVILFVYIFSTN